MEIVLFGDNANLNLKLTLKLSIIISEMMERKNRELEQFKCFPVVADSDVLTTLDKDIKSLYPESSYIETINKIDLFRINFKTQENSLVAFYDLDRRENIPVKFEVDYYYQNAQIPKDHITLEEEPFLFFSNGYIYYYDLERIKAFKAFHGFIDSLYENVFAQISDILCCFNLRRKYFSHSDLLYILDKLSFQISQGRDFSAESIMIFLKALNNKKIRFKLKNNKIILTPLKAIIVMIKALLDEQIT